MNSLIHPRRGLWLAFLFTGSFAFAQQPEVVSVASGGTPSDGSTWSVSATRDGRYVAFVSFGTNLVPNDTNNRPDAFVRDLQTGATVRVDVDSSGQEADMGVSACSISADGSRVTFISTSTNLVAGTSSFMPAVYVHDMQSGATTLASVDANGAALQGPCSDATLSADGNHVLFQVKAPSLGPVLSPIAWYVRNLLTQTTTLVVPSGDGGGYMPRYNNGLLLGDGKWIALTRYVPAGLEGNTETTTRILIIDRDADGNGVFDEPGTYGRKYIQPTHTAPATVLLSISANGRFLSYISASFSSMDRTVWLHDRDSDGNGIYDEDGGAPDQYISDRVTGYDLAAIGRAITDDGHYVAIIDLTPDQPTGLLVKNMQTGATFLQTFDSTGQAVNVSAGATISNDGAWLFDSIAAGLSSADTNGFADAYRIPRTESTCTAPFLFGSATSNSAYALGAVLTYTGSTHIGADNFTLFTQYVPNSTGQFFYGPEHVSTPFGDGTRFVGGGSLGVFRLPIVHPTGNVVSYQLHFGMPPANAGPGHIIPGSTWNFQYAFRDPNSGTFGFNTSNALSVTFCP